MGFLNSLAYEMMDNKKLHYKDNSGLSGKTQWLITLSSVLSAFNGDYVNAIETGKDNETLEKGISEMWDIKDRQSFLDNAQWLVQEGQRDKYKPQLELVQLVHPYLFEKPIPVIGPLLESESFEGLLFMISNIRILTGSKTQVEGIANKLGIKFTDVNGMLPEMEAWIARIHRGQLGNPASINNLVAWDAVRLVNTARWAVQLGYITEHEFLEYADGLTEQVQNAYQSWDQVILAYAIGGFIWNSESNRVEHMIRTLKMLKKDSNSPVNQVPFKLL